MILPHFPHSSETKKMVSQDQTLALSLGFTTTPSSNNAYEIRPQPAISTAFEPSLTLSLTYDHVTNKSDYDHELSKKSELSRSGSGDDFGSQVSPVSSFSVKKEISGSEEVERSCSRPREDEEGDDDGGNKKKLRLSKQQSALLEESFKLQSTLNPKQKQALAAQLRLRPRQIEVWFQNRRARTKLKQTELDCGFWKRCCESLTDENRKLHKELQELRSLKLSHPPPSAPFYMQFPATTLTMCPSCEKIGASKMVVSTPTPAPASKSVLFFGQFPKPSSAAC